MRDFYFYCSNSASITLIVIISGKVFKRRPKLIHTNNRYLFHHEWLITQHLVLLVIIHYTKERGHPLLLQTFIGQVTFCFICGVFYVYVYDDNVFFFAAIAGEEHRRANESGRAVLWNKPIQYRPTAMSSAIPYHPSQGKPQLYPAFHGLRHSYQPTAQSSPMKHDVSSKQGQSANIYHIDGRSMKQQSQSNLSLDKSNERHSYPDIKHEDLADLRQSSYDSLASMRRDQMPIYQIQIPPQNSVQVCFVYSKNVNDHCSSFFRWSRQEVLLKELDMFLVQVQITLHHLHLTIQQ